MRKSQAGEGNFKRLERRRVVPPRFRQDSFFRLGFDEPRNWGTIDHKLSWGPLFAFALLDEPGRQGDDSLRVSYGVHHSKFGRELGRELPAGQNCIKRLLKTNQSG